VAGGKWGCGGEWVVGVGGVGGVGGMRHSWKFLRGVIVGAIGRWIKR